MAANDPRPVLILPLSDPFSLPIYHIINIFAMIASLYDRLGPTLKWLVVKKSGWGSDNVSVFIISL